MKARDAQRKQARTKIKTKVGQNAENIVDNYPDDDQLPSPVHTVVENSSDKENKSEPLSVKTGENPDLFLADQTLLNPHDDPVQEDTSEEGWQEAVPKGRSPTGRKASGSRRPSLAKLNTNFMNAHPAKFRSKTTTFVSPKTSPNEPAASSTPTSAAKKYVKSPRFSPKSSNPTVPTTGAEKLSNPRSSPASAVSNDPMTKHGQILSSVSVQAAGKLFSYKEVALARPGTIVKAVNEQLPNENSAEGSASATATSNNGGKEHVRGTIELEKSLDSDNKNQQRGEGNMSAVEAVECKKNKASDTEGPSEIQGAKSAAETKAGEESEHASTMETDGSDLSKELDSTTSTDHALERQDSKCAAASSDIDTTLSEKDASTFNEEVGNKEGDINRTSDGEEVASLPAEELNKDHVTAGPLPAEAEKPGDPETGKGKKLSAAAPPFNPSTVPVFGSVPVAGYKEHGGILPPPVNIPPMLPVNPVRRSPHPSATARVPYGPRLSGGYNRSGSRTPRNKPSFHSTEHTLDAGPFSPPGVMNPHAAEFVPGLPWVQNGYPVALNGYMAYPNTISVLPNGYPMSQNGMPMPSNGSPTSSDGVPVTPDGSTIPNVGSVDTDAAVIVEEDVKSQDEIAEGNSEALSVNLEVSNSSIVQTQDEPQVCKESLVNESGVNENAPTRIEEEKFEDPAPPTTKIAVTTETCSSIVVEEKKTKCWGDYSDSEAEIVEAKS